MKYRKKPVVIEAIQFAVPADAERIIEWMAAYVPMLPVYGAHAIEIQTLEGAMRADIGDWIIRGVKGEFYPCKPDIFDATYELAEEGPA